MKAARIAEDVRIKPFSSREVVAPGTISSDRIILGAESRELTPIFGGEVGVSAELREAQIANERAASIKKSQSIDLDIRQELHNMNSASGGSNIEMTNALADTQVGIGSQQAVANWHGAMEVTRPTIVTKLETAEAKGEIEKVISARWITIAGEDAGSVSYELPKVLSLADRVPLKRDSSIADAVKTEIKTFGFSANKLWDVMEGAKKTLSWREAEARYIWADQLPAKSLGENPLIHANDLPLLERFAKDKNVAFRVAVPEKSGGFSELTFGSADDLKEYIVSQKQALASDMILKRIGLNGETLAEETTLAAISKSLNADMKWLDRTAIDATNPNKGAFAWQDATTAIHNDRVAKGLANANDIPVPAYFKPKVVKATYDASSTVGENGHVVDAMTKMKAQQKEWEETAVRTFTKQAGADIADRLPNIRPELLQQANSGGAGAGFIKFAQASYGSLEAIFQHMGGVSKDLQLATRKSVDAQVTSSLYHLSQNPEAAIEFSRVNQLLSKTAEDYVFDTTEILGMGHDVLIPKKVRDAMLRGEEGTKSIDDVTLQAGAPQYIQLQNWQTAQALRSHSNLLDQWATNRAERYAALGKMDDKPLGVVRAIAPSPKDFPFIALVKDPMVTGAGHTTMLFANSEKELQALIAKTNRDFPQFEVLTKSDTAEYYKAHQAYEYDMGLNKNYIDSSLKREGIYSNFYTQTDPKKIVDSVLQYHYRQADLHSAELMRLRYGKEFNWLEDQANSYSSIESSKLAPGSIAKIQENEKNPYISYIKTGLNLSSVPTSNPWWTLNKFLDNQVSKVVGQARQVFDASRGVEDLNAVNAILEKYGSNTAFSSAAEMALVNHTAPKAELSKFIRGANAIMSRFTLGLDPLNAVNNAVGANVLRGTELNQFVKAINSGNTELGGALANLAHVAIPGVEGQTILSPAKLIASSFSRLFGKDGAALRAEYKEAGFIRGRLEQFASIQDDLALQGTESVKDLQSKLGGAFAKAKELVAAGEKYSGNNFAEEFNRFISADVMRQITDLGQKAGILTKQEAGVYINNFVNRVEGNVIASQRPGLFQGPLGQAIGLFQSYQFNLMQNLFRYVAEGTGKDTAMLLGLQGTFYGLQGEPGFKFLNDHIVGTLSGNTQHRDIYDITRGIAGKTGGDWLLYGAASNIMQTNLYSRGDINPRQLTIVPTNLADVPFVGGMSKVFGSLFEVAQKIGAGGNVWETIRQGIEHNGVSRPLAGLAQVSRGITGPTVFSTSTKGSIIGSNDLMSLATLSRIAGGKPLDEAVQTDTMFSINSYEAMDRRKKNMLAETVKTTQLPGQEADPDQINKFAAAYLLTGGKQGGFTKYMMEQYTKANTPQAQLLAAKLNNPLSYKIQALMGGMEN